MSLKRIVTVVVVVVVALALVYCLLDWESTKQVGAYVQSGLDARLHPDEWQLGDVRVVKSPGYEQWDMACYIASDDESTVTFMVEESASGSPYEAASAPVPASGMAATILPSGEKLVEEVLTPEASAVARHAENMVAKMRQHRPWPWTLRPIGGLMSAIAQRRYRLETQPLEPTFVLLTEFVYGGEAAYEVISASTWKRMYLLPDKCVLTHGAGRSGLVLSPGGNTAYAEDVDKLQQLEDESRTSFARAAAVLQASPDVPPAVVERLAAAEKWLAAGNFKLLPPPEGDELKLIAKPWELPATVDVAGPLGYSEVPETPPATISGVEISEVRAGDTAKDVRLARGGNVFEWRRYPGKSTLRHVRSGYSSFYLTIPDREGHQVASPRFSDAEMNDTLAVLQGIARDLLAAPAENWPETAWRDELRAALAAFSQGRFYARSSQGARSVEPRLVFEGGDSWALFAQTYYGPCAGILELCLLTDGFAVRDTYSGCLLEVDGGAAALTQTHESAGAGASLHLAEAAALAEWASGSADKLPPGLAASLTQAREFLALPSLPSATLVDSMEVPAWSLEKIHQRTPARKPSASG